MEGLQTVVFAVVAIAAVIGVATLIGREDDYARIGRGGLSLDRDGTTEGEGAAGPGGLAPPPAEPSLEQEVRELVARRNARRERAGEPPLDVEVEVARQLRELGGGPPV